MENPQKSRKRILHLTLHRRYFAEIVARTKHIEYRSQSPYWKSRLEGHEYDLILFRNGYNRSAPSILVEYRGLRRYGKGRGAYYAIRLGRILEIKRWPKRLLQMDDGWHGARPALRDAGA